VLQAVGEHSERQGLGARPPALASRHKRGRPAGRGLRQ
jgi:hypothetical protein